MVLIRVKLSLPIAGLELAPPGGSMFYDTFTHEGEFKVYLILLWEYLKSVCSVTIS